MNTMITMDNYEGYLMHYADDLLNEDERAAVDAFLLLHPELRDEMEDVASVRVMPAQLTMPHKESLKRGTTIPLWQRFAAAASIAALILVGATLFLINSRQPIPSDVVAKNGVTPPAVPDSSQQVIVPADESFASQVQKPAKNQRAHAEPTPSAQNPIVEQPIEDESLFADAKPNVDDYNLDVPNTSSEELPEPTTEESLEEQTKPYLPQPRAEIMVVEVKNATLTRSLRDDFLAMIM